MSEHKHVEMTNVSVVGIDDNGNPIMATQKAVMDVPVADLASFQADAAGRWQRVDVSDECPEHCTAQMTIPESEREDKLKYAHSLRADDSDQE